jgi:DNA polymerase-1
MSKNRCSFNELEFRRMAEQFDAIFKRGTANRKQACDDELIQKTPQKKRRSV